MNKKKFRKVVQLSQKIKDKEEEIWETESEIKYNLILFLGGFPVEN